MERDRPPLAGLDLNLLVTLRALLREGSVTRAAAQLGQRQPTVSRSLATLRSAFDDPLLVRAGRGMAPTPFALALRPALERSLASLDRLVTTAGFEPSTSDRTFRMVLPDLLAELALPLIAQRVASEAPGVSMQVLGHEGDVLAALLEDRLDLVVGAPVIDHPEFASRRVREVDMTWSVVFGPLCLPAGSMDVATWCSAHHVVLVPGGRPELPGPLDRVLDAAALRRVTRLHVSHLSGLGAVLAVTPWVASLPTPVAVRVARGNDLVAAPHPLSSQLPNVSVRLTWLAAHQHEPGHVWLRDLVEAAVSGAIAGQSEAAISRNSAVFSSSQSAPGSTQKVL